MVYYSVLQTIASVACYQVEDVVVNQDVKIGNILGVNTSLVLMDFEQFITAYNRMLGAIHKYHALKFRKYLYYSMNTECMM